jgi:predicted NAD-dependent protein-ADP-ribosyltransferase YbiA (DUF1768 family)
MRVILKPGLIVLVAETDAETLDVAAFGREARDHAFRVTTAGDEGLHLADLGPAADACREPINVTSLSADPAVAILGNFAATPFMLDRRYYESIESFWQGLKFEADGDRKRLARLDGRRAKTEGGTVSQPATFDYEGQTITAGTWQHWKLMEHACRAKFSQNKVAADALLATGERPLVHIVKPDSKTIPGVIMAEIWMRIRRELRRRV